MKKKNNSYKKSGVNISLANKLVKHISHVSKKNVKKKRSSLEKDVIKGMNTGNIEAAKIIGKLIAERAIQKKVTEVAFDRSGFNYHGRVKALADSARENGLKF